LGYDLGAKSTQVDGHQVGAGDAFLAPEERLQAGSRAQGASLALLNTTKNRILP